MQVGDNGYATELRDFIGVAGLAFSHPKNRVVQGQNERLHGQKDNFSVMFLA